MLAEHDGKGSIICPLVKLMGAFAFLITWKSACLCLSIDMVIISHRDGAHVKRRDAHFEPHIHGHMTSNGFTCRAVKPEASFYR
jgi:hypothetical protein